MIEKVFTKYFDDLTVEDINDLLKELGSDEEIVDFVDVNKLDCNLNDFTEKLYIKKDGNYLNIKFDFFEHSQEDLEYIALRTYLANELIKEYQMKNDLNDLDIETIIIVKEPITGKHNNTISIFDEDYTIPIFSLSKLYNKTLDNKKISEKLSKLKNKNANEFLSDFLSTLDVNETNDLLKLLDQCIEIEELFELQFDGFKIVRTKNDGYFNIILMHDEPDEEFINDLVKKSNKIFNEIYDEYDINKPINTLLLVNNENNKINDSKLESILNMVKLSTGVDIECPDDLSNFCNTKNKESLHERIEDLKLSFGDVLDKPSNINAIFSLLDKDVTIKTFLDFQFGNNDETTFHKVAIDSKHNLLNLVLYFGEYSEELLKQEAENARKISKQLNNSVPIKTYAVLFINSVNEKVQHVDLGDDGVYEVEFCPMSEYDSKKHLNRILKEVCR